jgi:hypothetical protein
MSLFISAWRLPEEADLEAAKVGILVASLTAGLVGYFILRFSLGGRKRSRLGLAHLAEIAASEGVQGGYGQEHPLP